MRQLWNSLTTPIKLGILAFVVAVLIVCGLLVKGWIDERARAEADAIERGRAEQRQADIKEITEANARAKLWEDRAREWEEKAKIAEVAIQAAGARAEAAKEKVQNEVEKLEAEMADVSADVDICTRLRRVCSRLSISARDCPCQ